MTTPKGAARAAQDSTAFRVVARIGYVVLGILHIVIGVIAISIATGGGGEADQGGALEQIQQRARRRGAAVGDRLGLIALAIWQIAEAFLERNPDTKKKWGYRIKYVGTAVAYIAIAITALVYALGRPIRLLRVLAVLQRSAPRHPRRGVPARPRRTHRRGDRHRLHLPGHHPRVQEEPHPALRRGDTGAEQTAKEGARTGIVAFGVVGYIAKGIAVAVTGVLFVVAAFTHDPATAGGLDAALHSLAALPFGPIILWIVGAGLVIYGLFCFARARYAKM